MAEQDDIAEKDGLNIPMIVTVGLISVVVTAVSVIAVQTLYYSYAADETQRKVVEAPTANADSKLAEQIAKLSRYSWTDRKKGIVTVPIERAMRLVVQEKRTLQAGDGAAEPVNSEVQ